MPPLPEMIIAVLAPFAGLFSTSVWRHAQVLMIGAILCQGPRTVAATLRVMGLGQEPRFERYHRVLNRAHWSGLQAAKMLLGLVIQVLPPSWVPIVVVDDTVERRRGKRIKAKGCYRDAVRSTQHQVVKCFGLRWVCLMLLVRLPWSSRLWALPFLTVLAPSEAAKAEGREQNINQHIAADRAANGGKLTPQEKRNINKRQNGASRQIYNEKHNGKTVPR